VTSIPATVTIIDLPAGTTPTGVELIEGVQTSGGVANSVKFTLTQVVGSLGGLPAGGGTGQLLGSLGTGFSASWITLSSVVTASTGISVAGSTTLVLALATAGGPSVLGVAGVATANPLPIVGAAAQVLRVNDGGTGVAFGAVNLGSAAAVTGVLPGANYSAVNLAAGNVAGGVQGVLPGANYSAVNLAASGAGGVQGVLPVSNGGQGTSTLTAHGVLIGAGTTKVSITGVQSAGQLLVGQNATTDPAWQTVSGDIGLTAGGVATVSAFAITSSKIATAAVGSTQIATGAVGTTQLLTAAGLSVLAVNSSGATNFSVISGTAAQVLRVNDAGTGLVFGAVNLASSAAVTGTLGVANGGVGIASYAVGDILFASTATSLSRLAGGTSGWPLVARGNATSPVYTTVVPTLSGQTVFNNTTLGTGLIVNDTATYFFGEPSKLNVHITTGATAGGFIRWSGPTSEGPDYDLAKSRGTTINDFAIVSTGDQLGAFRFFGANGATAFLGAAALVAEVDTGTVSSTSMPGRLSFQTTPSGASSPVVALRIDATQQVQLMTASFTANAAGTVTISNVRPAGAATATIAKWFQFKDQNGLDSYIPIWQ
jgi:hypothetical protein